MDKETEVIITELSEKIDRLSSLILTKVISSSENKNSLKNGNGRRLMSVKQASDYLGVSISTLQNWAKHRKITNYKYEGKIVFEEKDLEKFLQGARIESIHDSIQKAANRGR